MITKQYQWKFIQINTFNLNTVRNLGIDVIKNDMYVFIQWCGDPLYRSHPICQRSVSRSGHCVNTVIQHSANLITANTPRYHIDTQILNTEHHLTWVSFTSLEEVLYFQQLKHVSLIGLYVLLTANTMPP